MSQVSSNLSLVSRYADDIEKDGVTLHHRGDEYVVPAGDIKLPQTSVIKELGAKIASPRIVLNGRQLGGDYDEIFDSMGPATEFVVTAQNGPSARMLADAAQKYVERHPEKRAIIENVVGLVSASFVSSGRLDGVEGHAIAEIKADGHCMYRSVEHQLSVRGVTDETVATDHVSLRRMTADRLRADEWDYRPFAEDFAEATEQMMTIVERFGSFTKRGVADVRQNLRRVREKGRKSSSSMRAFLADELRRGGS